MQIGTGYSPGEPPPIYLCPQIPVPINNSVVSAVDSLLGYTNIPNCPILSFNIRFLSSWEILKPGWIASPDTQREARTHDSRLSNLHMELFFVRDNRESCLIEIIDLKHSSLQLNPAALHLLHHQFSRNIIAQITVRLVQHKPSILPPLYHICPFGERSLYNLFIHC